MDERRNPDKDDNRDVTYQTVRDSSNTLIVPNQPSRGTPYEDSRSCQESNILILNACLKEVCSREICEGEFLATGL
jgi:hypothetical protein